MVNRDSSTRFRSPLTIGLVSFMALLIGVAATAALDHIDSYRLQVIGTAPCTKRALGFGAFESVLSWISLTCLGMALIVGLVALVLSRGPGQRSRLVDPVLLVVMSALMLALAVVSQSSPFDFDDSTLPMCGATGKPGGL